jgi:hypothetical protein
MLELAPLTALMTLSATLRIVVAEAYENDSPGHLGQPGIRGVDYW